MAGMNQLPRPWVIVIVMVAVFLGALSMHMERMAGWGFLTLCFVVGSVGGLAVISIRNQAAVGWNQLSKWQKRIGMATGIVLVLVVTFASNRHKPDEFANDAATCCALVIGLSLWGLARLMKGVVDRVHARFSKR
jgi:low affinity Fe/Cu permease